MGKLYMKTISGEDTLAYYDGGRVWCARYSTGTEVQYKGGDIYYNEAGYGHHTIARCDSNGNIYEGNGTYGSILAKCKDGVIYEGGSDWNSQLAWYDGDMYGAAAAAAVTVLGLGAAPRSSGSKNSSAAPTGNDKTARAASGSVNRSASGSAGAGSILVGLLAGILLLLPRVVLYFPALVLELLSGRLLWQLDYEIMLASYLPGVLYNVLTYLCLLLTWRRLRRMSGGKPWIFWLCPVLYLAPAILIRNVWMNGSSLTILFLTAGIVWELRRLQSVGVNLSGQELTRVYFAVFLSLALSLILRFYYIVIIHEIFIMGWLPFLAVSAVQLATPILLLRQRDVQIHSARSYWLWTAVSFGLTLLSAMLSRAAMMAPWM